MSRSDQEILSIAGLVYEKLEGFVKPGFEFLAKATENGVKEIIEQETAKAIQRIQEAADRAPLTANERFNRLLELGKTYYHIGNREKAEKVLQQAEMLFMPTITVPSGEELKP